MQKWPSLHFLPTCKQSNKRSALSSYLIEMLDGDQCDQIGLFLRDLNDKNSLQSNKNIFAKSAVAYFLAPLSRNWATFYSNIWSYWWWYKNQSSMWSTQMHAGPLTKHMKLLSVFWLKSLLRVYNKNKPSLSSFMLNQNKQSLRISYVRERKTCGLELFLKNGHLPASFCW